MSDNVFYDSPYKFSKVRFFKENDPYYFRVDNIPLKQLDENIKFCKDQIRNILSPENQNISISREGFSELRPSVEGTNNKVKVAPGKFTARVNDAYNLTPFQFLEQIYGFNAFDSNFWKVRTNASQAIRSIMDELATSVFPANFNGLMERAYTFAMATTELVHPNSPRFSPVTPGDGVRNPPSPNFLGRLWQYGSSVATKDISLFNAEDNTIGLIGAANAESEFIKKWRGIARTAIVSVEEDLEIDIPSFDENDFFYIDQNGEKIKLDANHRIDLLFIYTKPIDVSSTTISRFVSESPVVITKPELGIVKGAGIGFSMVQSGGVGSKVSLSLPDGTPIIMANPGDELGINTGIGEIKGSFPSPDDLMNISPLITENVESNHFSLIGQSILPIAYIVVRKEASITNTGNSIITVDDLIDIRPFFRTTELSYNERAGIAAATPQISLANPVATEAYVEFHTKNLVDDYNRKINQLESSIGGNTQNPSNPAVPQIITPRVVGAGYIQGGYNFGVEGSLARYLQTRLNITEKQRLKQELGARYTLPTGLQISDYPDWDLAEWCVRGSFQEKGTYPADYINIHSIAPTTVNRVGTILNRTVQNTTDPDPLEFTSFRNRELTSRLRYLASHTAKRVGIYFVKKRIQIDRTQIPWADDYHVDVQFWNCAPLTGRDNPVGVCDVWVDKRKDEFTIFIAWAGTKDMTENRIYFPHLSRNAGENFAGFTVINSDMMSFDYSNAKVLGEVTCGAAIYPTVTFKITGIPNGMQTNLNQFNPVITLS